MRIFVDRSVRGKESGTMRIFVWDLRKNFNRAQRLKLNEALENASGLLRRLAPTVKQLGSVCQISFSIFRFKLLQKNMLNRESNLSDETRKNNNGCKPIFKKIEGPHCFKLFRQGY